MMAAVVTVEAIIRAKLQSNCYEQQTKTQLFDRLHALPVVQPGSTKVLQRRTFWELLQGARSF